MLAKLAEKHDFFKEWGISEVDMSRAAALAVSVIKLVQKQTKKEPPKPKTVKRNIIILLKVSSAYSPAHIVRQLKQGITESTH